MPTTIKGYYEDGKVTLIEQPPVQANTEVEVIFPTEEPPKEAKKIKLGLWQGKFTVPDDFNEPLDELKDYM